MHQRTLVTALMALALSQYAPAATAQSCPSVTPSQCATLASITPTTGPTNGPLTRAAGTPYFQDGSDNVVYLTGSHTWNNLQDWGDCRGAFNYTAYLNMMASCGHNFMRMWAFEGPSIGADGPYDPNLNPLPWIREAKSGRAGASRFDLSGNPIAINDVYIKRLQARVGEAQDKGIYVSVMLFQGWSIQNKPGTAQQPWPSHPFNDGNNNIVLDGDSSNNGQGEEVHQALTTSAAPGPLINRIQKDYVEAVVTALSGYDNVLWEISNESDATSDAWQDQVVDFIDSLDQTHPIGRTSYGFGSSNADLRAHTDVSWYSPAVTSNEDYANDPPANLAGKVVISDTDHIAGVLSQNAATHRQWIWKNLTRGLQSIVMDAVSHAFSQSFASATDPNLAKWPLIRRYLGQANHYAQRLDLARAKALTPATCSSFCLGVADPGQLKEQYLIYSPAGSTVDVKLDAGEYEGQWFNTATGQTETAVIDSIGIAETLNKPNGYDDAVLFLERIPQAPPTVELVARYVPGFGQPETESRSQSMAPDAFDYFYDPNLGKFEQRTTGPCPLPSNNPTYLRVTMDVDQTIDGCTFKGSWDDPAAPPSTCSPAAVALLDGGGEIILNTDDILTATSGSCEDLAPAVPHIGYNEQHYFDVTAIIDGVSYPRRVRFRNKADVRHLVAVDDTFVAQAQPNDTFGHAILMRARHNDPNIKFGFLSFQIPTISGPSSLASRQLQLSVLTGTQASVEFHDLCGNGPWSEGQLTWNNWAMLTGGSCGVEHLEAGWTSGNRKRINLSGWILGPGRWDTGFVTNIDTAGNLVVGSTEHGAASERPKLVLTYQR